MSAGADVSRVLGLKQKMQIPKTRSGPTGPVSAPPYSMLFSDSVMLIR